MRRFYVVISPWDELLYRVIGWTENEYIANVFYDGLFKDGEEVNLVSYECENLLILSHILKEEYNIEVEDTVNTKLISKTSNDDKLFVIFRQEYSELFDISNINHIIHREGFSRIFLSSAPFVKYINNIGDDILNVVFLAYRYLTYSKSDAKFDMVYLWYFILISNVDFIMRKTNKIKGLIPDDVVFLST